MCWFLLSTTSFAGKCKVVEIRISTAKSEAMFLIWKWSTHFWSETRCCPKWKNLNILFKCEGRDTLGLYRSGMVNRELNLQVKLLIYRSIYIPVLTYGHMHWVVTARKRLEAQNSLSLKTGWYFPYWEGEDSHLGGAQTRAATPQHQKDPVQVVQPYDRDASRVRCSRRGPKVVPEHTGEIFVS